MPVIEPPGVPLFDHVIAPTPPVAVHVEESPTMIVDGVQPLIARAGLTVTVTFDVWPCESVAVIVSLPEAVEPV